MSEELTWFDAPDPTEVHATYKALAVVRGKMLRLERYIARETSKLKKEKEFARKPAERELAVSDQLDTLTEYKVEEVRLEQEIKFYDKRFDMFKALAYRKG